VLIISALIFLLKHENALIISRRCTAINNKQEHQINEFIHDKEVLVIGSDGEKLGVMPSSKAKQLAYDKDLDLVKIAPTAKPPVCKIMDYKKFVFEQNKREKEAKKNQKVVAIKEIRMFSAIDTHDFETKVNQATKFLKSGDKLKVSVRFRKRAIAHPQIGEELLKRFGEACSEFGVIDKAPKMEGRSYVMFIAPKGSNK
jgi:translation initiation factor IF-3